MKIYLVGGAVRNELLNLPITEKDWVVVGSNPEKMIKKGYQQVGNYFPVFLHPISREEYALARTEKKSGYGHTDFITNYSSKISLEEDLMRRDLTINAIAKDKFNKYIDPFKGLKDIQLRLLRHVSLSFSEDPLRILRVARFAAFLYHLGFYIHKSTMKLMKKMVISNALSNISKERIWKETEKALKCSNPHIYFYILYKCQALFFLFPEIYIVYKKNNFFINLRKNKYLCTALKISAYIQANIEIRFSILCFYFAKIIKKDNNIHNIIQIIQNLCNRLRVPKYIKKLAILTVKTIDYIENIKKKYIKYYRFI